MCCVQHSVGRAQRLEDGSTKKNPDGGDFRGHVGHGILAFVFCICDCEVFHT